MAPNIHRVEYTAQSITAIPTKYFLSVKKGGGSSC